MFNYLKNNKIYKKINKNINLGYKTFSTSGMCDSGKVFFVSIFDKKKLVVFADENDSLMFFNEYKFYDDNVYLYKEKDILFSNKNIDDEKIYIDRMNIINKIINNEKITVVITIQSLREKIQKFDTFTNRIIKIEKNKNVLFEKFINDLNENGYSRVYNVENINEYSIRGGIVDIFLQNYENPIRIEFFGDEIESIRFFDIDSKKSFEQVEQIIVYPVKEDDNAKSDYIDIVSIFGDDSIIFFDEKEKIDLKNNMINEMLNEVRDRQFDEEEDIFYKPNLYSLDDIDFSNKTIIYLNDFDKNVYDNDNQYDFNVQTIKFNKNDFNNTMEKLKEYLKKKYKIMFVINSNIKSNRIINDFKQYNVDSYIVNDCDLEINSGLISIYVGELKNGFVIDEEKFVLITENDIYGIKQERKNKIIKNKPVVKEGFELINSIKDLQIDDYVVHDNYGIGIYKGLVHMTTDDVSKDYIKIVYADNGVLYVLVTKLEVIQKYASKNTKPPKLNSLSNKDFIKAKNKIKTEVLEIAKELIDLYAKRKKQTGFKYSKDTLWQKEFEETFPYIETYDQLVAIDQVKSDMESDKPMDRLICGDVGFGKTEIAIRAAFKAVQDNKQVAYLTPTTILTMQHFNTFKNRFSTYPINIDFLSRFKTEKQNKTTIEKIKTGNIDIVIGTHRLLSNDVIFKDLGLLIIDEEQRFGVSHKEKIKKIRNDIDVLSLSATPIPRTLYMSLNGIRDMSILSTAPPDRMPIKTYVLKYNEELIKEAINRELKRNGQVFIIHNIVKDIYEFAKTIEKICPDATIAVGHGKMNEDELSNIMSDFIEGKYNVLVSTTIIETGIDIPNANTLIVDNAEDFGLSQLYQLRGRVGRSNRTAYAFFLYGKQKYLTEQSEKRLKSIKEFRTLGSGIKIAMRDLELRGAGNVLGLDQSGHLDAVGYELYVKLLNKALEYMSKEENENLIREKFINSFDTIVDIDIDAYIPNEYIEDEKTKLEIYKKISKCENEKELIDLEEMFLDRFGKTPIEVENLLFIAKLKIEAHKKYLLELIIKKDSIRFTFCQNAKVNTNSIVYIINKYNGNIKIENGEQVKLFYRPKDFKINNIEKMLEIAKDVINDIKTF